MEPNAGQGGVFVALAVAIGLGTLAPILAPAIATRDSAEARRAGVAALACALITAIVVAATMALTTLAVDREITGHRLDRLPPAIMTANAQGFLSLCGATGTAPTQTASACRATASGSEVLSQSDVRPGGAFLVFGLADLSNLGRAVAGLAIAGAVAASLAVAAAGLHTFATAFGHDAFYRVRDTTALTSRRLAVTRLVAVAGLVAGGYMLGRQSVDPRALITLAITLAAASIAPLLVLSLWPRAEGVEAILALLAGLATTEAVIFAAGSAPTLEIFAHAALIAFAVSLLVGAVASFFHADDPTSHGSAFVHGVLHGETDVLNPDKGA